MVIDTTVKNVVVIKSNIARLKLDNKLVRQDLFKGVGVALRVGARALVRAGDENERLILVQGKVVLGVVSGTVKTLHLLLSRGLGRDIVTVPAELKERLGADEHVEELHDEVLVSAGHELAHNAEDFLGEVKLGKGLVAGQLGVHHVLNTPDTLFGLKLPGRKLLADGADVRPLALAAHGFDLAAGLAEGLEALGGDNVFDNDEAIALEVGEVAGRLLGRHCEYVCVCVCMCVMYRELL